MPPTCLSCGAETMTSGLLCTACFCSLTPIGLACRHCALPVPSAAYLGSDGRCAQCAVAPYPWTAARAAYLYDGTARRLVLQCKYGDRLDIAPFLARVMADMMGDESAERRLLVPVPLHRQRFWERRFNQAALLAGHLVRSSPHWRLLPDALVRHRSTATLARLAPELREQALDAAFHVRDRIKRLIEGQHVVLVDDILTTGATASICAKQLLGAGARCVDLLVATRTVKLAGDHDHQGGIQE
ncbi:competence protein ComF [Asaia sp. SF2.1]|nr:competence protein ComF [Asaia sp. SF2.1]